MGSTYSFGLLFLADWAQRAEQSNRIAAEHRGERSEPSDSSERSGRSN